MPWLCGGGTRRGKSNFSPPTVVVKHRVFSLGAMKETELQDAVHSTFVIVFLMLSILSVKKFINIKL